MTELLLNLFVFAVLCAFVVVAAISLSGLVRFKWHRWQQRRDRRRLS